MGEKSVEDEDEEESRSEGAADIAQAAIFLSSSTGVYLSLPKPFSFFSFLKNLTNFIF